jgi:hypothetical protein
MGFFIHPPKSETWTRGQIKLAEALAHLIHLPKTSNFPERILRFVNGFDKVPDHILELVAEETLEQCRARKLKKITNDDIADMCSAAIRVDSEFAKRCLSWVLDKRRRVQLKKHSD